MFSTGKVLIVVLLIGAAVIPPAKSTTSCYICNSRNQPGCDLSDRISSYYHDCNSMQDRCLKVVGPGDLVVRSCAGTSAPLATEGCLINGDIRTCICFGNYCNTATSDKQFSMWILATMSASAIYLSFASNYHIF